MKSTNKLNIDKKLYTIYIKGNKIKPNIRTEIWNKIGRYTSLKTIESLWEALDHEMFMATNTINNHSRNLL